MAAEVAGRSCRRGAGVRCSFERLENRRALAADGSLPTFDFAAAIVTDLWVDPVAGDDAATGASRTAALRTVTEAWRRIPSGTPLSVGVRIDLVAGTYDENMVPVYWERRHGTSAAPIILLAADGAGSARLPAMNVADCSNLYLDGLVISSGGGDVLHFDSCTAVLVRDTAIVGTGSIVDYACPQEALKVNQCRDVFVEGCDISGAWDNAIDFVAVQGGHVVGSRIHRSGDWAMYVKGGSAGILVAGNELYDAGTGGFTAGQGTGLEWMVAPSLTYEATDILFTRNIIHDTDGAGVGVNGGRNVAITSNVMVRVGARSHVIEVGFGSRSCDGDTARCTALLAQGAWGTNVVGVEVPIPNDGVSIIGNVVFNPDGFASQWQQFFVADPRLAPDGSIVPSPVRADTDLTIADNIIWNGSPSLDLGIGSPELAARVVATNSINTLRPVLVDPPHGDYRLTDGSPRPANWLGTPVVAPIPTSPAPEVAVTFADAPASLTATRANGQAGLTWKAPASNGGSAIIDYVVQSSADGGRTWKAVAHKASTMTTMTVTGLANGTGYLFRIAAVNGVGTGAFTTPTVAVVPATFADAATAVAAKRGNGQVGLTWKAPASNGGSAITDYVVQSSADGGKTWKAFAHKASAATTMTVTGLANGTGYLFRIAAVNRIGTGPFTELTPAVVPATFPGTLTALTATRGNGHVGLTWKAPASSGGSAITDYLVQSSTDGGRTWKAFAHKASAATTIPVTGLVNGTGYLFRIAAVNDVGTGAFTKPTVAVVPATLPGIVADLAVTTDSGRAKLAWKAPASNGGTAILDYSIQWSDDDGRNWKTFAHKVSTATSATIAGLVSAASYRYRVAALNAVGTGGSIEVSKAAI